MSCETKKIPVKVVKFNHVDFPTGCTKEICCDMYKQGTFWKTPRLTIDGELDGYVHTPILNDDGSETRPSPDSYKIVKVVACGDKVEVIIEDTETAAILDVACNVCCGDPATPFEAEVPDIIYEQKPCADADGNRKISVAVPDGGALGLSGTFDGVAGAPAPDPTYASGAAIKTWLTANWGAYGVWSHNVADDVITLTLDASVESAGFQIVAQ